jgi:hypothetical protein
MHLYFISFIVTNLLSKHRTVHSITVHCVTYMSSCTLPSFFCPETFSLEYPPCTYKISSVTLTHICTPLRWRGTYNHTSKNKLLSFHVLNFITIQYTNTNVSRQIKWHKYTQIYWHVVTQTLTLTLTLTQTLLQTQTH